MSRTSRIGVVGAGFWSEMARVMEGCLDLIIKGREAKIPLGALYDALLFFRVVLSRKTGNTMFDNLQARGHAHLLAWKILNDCPALRSHTKREADWHFHEFADFLKSIADRPAVPFDNGGWYKQLTVPLSKRKQKTATDLRDFYAALLKMVTTGESRY